MLISFIPDLYNIICICNFPYLHGPLFELVAEYYSQFIHFEGIETAKMIQSGDVIII